MLPTFRWHLITVVGVAVSAPVFFLPGVCQAKLRVWGQDPFSNVTNRMPLDVGWCFHKLGFQKRSSISSFSKLSERSVAHSKKHHWPIRFYWQIVLQADILITPPQTCPWDYLRIPITPSFQVLSLIIVLCPFQGGPSGVQFSKPHHSRWAIHDGPNQHSGGKTLGYMD